MPLFKTIRSSANLPQPNPDIFFKYLHRYRKGNLLTLELEDRLCQVHGTNFCITFPSCFMSIVSCLAAFKVPKYSEVITPSFAYRRFGDIISWTNLIPHFCDINSNRLAPTVADVEKCIGPNTSAILMVHPMVRAIDFSEIEILAKDYNLPLIIDSVEAPYSSVKRRRVGSFGDAECFSMHASKLINAFDGGYITTNREDLANSLISFRAEADLCLFEPHAAMALSIMDEMPQQIITNKEKYNAYKKRLETVPGITLIEYSDDEPRGYKNILVKLEQGWPFTREHTIRMLQSQNILARPFWMPLHQEKTMYATLYSHLPNTEKIHQQYILLPCGSFTSLEDIEVICSFLHRVATENREQIWNESKCLPNNPPRERTCTVSTNQDKVFEGILRRRWYTSHGPLVEELEARLEKHLAIHNVIAVGNFSNAFMIAVKAITPDSIRIVGSLPSSAQKAAKLIGFKSFPNGLYRIIVSPSFDRPRYHCDLFILGNIKNEMSGYICTDNDELAEKIRNTRAVPGIRQKKRVYSTGNGRMSEAQAAIELIGLNELEQAEPCV